MVRPFFGAPLWLCGVAVLLAELSLLLLLLVEPQADNASTPATTVAAAVNLDKLAPPQDALVVVGGRPRRSASRTREAMLGPRTESSRSPPVTMVSASDDTLLSVSALRIVPSRKTATMTPSRLPRPPKIDTPPSRTHATTDSSRPVPLSPRALPKRIV